MTDVGLDKMRQLLDEHDELERKLATTEKERDVWKSAAQSWAKEADRLEKERDALRAQLDKPIRMASVQGWDAGVPWSVQGGAHSCAGYYPHGPNHWSQEKALDP